MSKYLNDNDNKNVVVHNDASPRSNHPQRILRHKPIDVIKPTPAVVFKEFEVKPLSYIDIDGADQVLNLKRSIDSLLSLKYSYLNESSVANRHQLHWVFNTDTLILKETSNLLVQLQDRYNALNINKENFSLSEGLTDKKESLNKYRILHLASHGILSDSTDLARLTSSWDGAGKTTDSDHSGNRNTKWYFISTCSSTYHAKTSDKLKIYLYLSSDSPGIVATQKTSPQSSLVSNLARYLKTNLYIPQGTCLELIANSVLQTENQDSDFYWKNRVKNYYKPSFTPMEDQKPFPVFSSATLLYRIGEQDSWKIYSPESTRDIQADNTGYLEFQIKDNSLSDQTGYYRMEVRVDKKD